MPSGHAVHKGSLSHPATGTVGTRMTDTTEGIDALVLLDWRRRVADLYTQARALAARGDPEAGWRHWRTGRDELFAGHAASPLPAEARAGFAGLHYYPYDPAARLVTRPVPAPAVEVGIADATGTPHAFTRVATVDISVNAATATLAVYWLHGYAGGLFLPLGDATNGVTTYGAGRYLLDTAKGADLGGAPHGDGGLGSLTVDLNFAANPSCSYDARWSCPLAPAENRLRIAVAAGERTVPV